MKYVRPTNNKFYKIVPIVPNAKDDESAENDEKV